MDKSIQSIKEMLSGINRHLFTKPNLVATGIGYKSVNGEKTGELCIICSVESKIREADLHGNQKIPSFVDGIPTDVHAVGLIHSFNPASAKLPVLPVDDAVTDEKISPAGKFRPVPGGVSIGHVHVSAGTMGCLVKKGGKLYILSNNHVLANSNNAGAGDLILQPGMFDGGIPAEDQIARLSEFIAIRFENEGSHFSNGITGLFNFIARITGSRSRFYSRRMDVKNLVDCAIAEPLEGIALTGDILHIGRIAGVAEGMLGMKVKKSGRTTGHTTGTIEQTDVTVRVNFGANKTALFTDQLIAGAMSQGGDSGSVVLSEENNEVIGLLFAGSTNTTIINRIQNVMDIMGIEPV
jgi:hypothetical protein